MTKMSRNLSHQLYNKLNDFQIKLFPESVLYGEGSGSGGGGRDEKLSPKAHGIEQIRRHTK